MMVFVGVILVPAVSVFPLENGSDKKIDPQAEKILKRMTSYLGGLDSFSTDVLQTIDLEKQGRKQKMVSDKSLALQKPDKLALIIKNGRFESTIVCDGVNVYEYFPMTEKYSEKEAPEKLNDLSISSTGPSGVYNRYLLDFLTKDDPYRELMKGVTSLKIAGGDGKGDSDDQRLILLKEDMDFSIWVSKGDRPLPRKMVLDLASAMKRAGEQLPARIRDLKMTWEIEFSNWETDLDFPDDTFSFIPPLDARKADSLLPARAEQKPAEKGLSKDLLGKPAPLFSLDLLNGGTFDLAAQKGKHIIILDFWATWCPPCQKALPVYQQLAEDYKEDGVRLIAVDLREKTEIIRQFLDERELDLTVALDTDGSVGTLYRVQSIPTTAIVGLDGTVQAVHVGYRSRYKGLLKYELDELLSGRQLVESAAR